MKVYVIKIAARGVRITVIFQKVVSDCNKMTSCRLFAWA